MWHIEMTAEMLAAVKKGIDDQLKGIVPLLTGDAAEVYFDFYDDPEIRAYAAEQIEVLVRPPFGGRLAVTIGDSGTEHLARASLKVGPNNGGDG